MNSDSSIPYGFCQCGCGETTTIAKTTDPRCEQFKGVPVRFINGHNSRGSGNSKWNGGKTQNSEGYVLVRQLGHPRAIKGYVLEHVLVAERALGRPLPPKAQVHHVNEVKDDNRNQNLVICEGEVYHKLLHRRAAAYAAMGNPDARKCKYCTQWDMTVTATKSGHTYHKSCEAAHSRMRHKKKLEKTL